MNTFDQDTYDTICVLLFHLGCAREFIPDEAGDGEYSKIDIDLALEEGEDWLKRNKYASCSSF